MDSLQAGPAHRFELDAPIETLFGPSPLDARPDAKERNEAVACAPPAGIARTTR
jgi:hypothetical protein